jgi:hypothetical protein
MITRPREQHGNVQGQPAQQRARLLRLPDPVEGVLHAQEQRQGRHQQDAEAHQREPAGVARELRHMLQHCLGDVGRQQAAQQVLADRFPGRAQGRDAREQGVAHGEQRHHGHHRRKGEAARRLGEAFFPATPEDEVDQAALVSACVCHWMQYIRGIVRI